ncbi:Nucleolar protein NOP2 [Giardia muris]|uniref:Nucleolar protein NOP2 n=1 Tax=Giardia muris TaxID=5742 RepID=A0A4Z1SSG0_GIAMU|nr:Nucleolar protein NOP2 [Giardia muris]|eukprot:TNJ28836.1 Nucleolar protein NOP2 [Giardia muris]
MKYPPLAPRQDSDETDSASSSCDSDTSQTPPEPQRKRALLDEEDESGDVFGTEQVDIGLMETRQSIAEARALQDEGLAEFRHAEHYDPRVDEVQGINDIRLRILRVIGTLANFKERRHPEVQRSYYVELLKKDISEAYGYSLDVVELLIGVFGPIELHSFVTACEKPRPLTIRVNTLKLKRRELAQILIARGVNLDPIGDWCKEGLQIFSSQVPIGATPEYLRGCYMIQDAASFLPPLALRPQPGERVLDMSAAPGGKTTHLGGLMQNSGVLVANDLNKERIPALQANLARMGITCAIVTNFDARELTKTMGGFDRILLDAPCTGLGVVSKDASIKANRSFKDVQQLSNLQKELLLAAIDLLSKTQKAPRLVCYSTCSVSIAENEAVINHALRHRNVEVVDLPFGFGKPGITRFMTASYHPSISKARRFYPHIHNTHGFFICLLRLRV